MGIIFDKKEVIPVTIGEAVRQRIIQLLNLYRFYTYFILNTPTLKQVAKSP